MKSGEQGFTIVELMVTIAVAAILFGLALPSLSRFVLVNQTSAAAEDLLADLYYARTEAIKEASTITLCASNNPTATAPSCAGTTATTFNGWVVFVDSNANGALDTGETVLRVHALMPTGITTSTDGDYVSFAATGFAQAPSAQNVTFCNKYGNTSSYAGNSASRAVTISATGRPAVVSSVAAITTALGSTHGTCP
jgi:type IV fimbrial biogenesis protein FimT